ncbi:MAG TPA: elongation factor G, partial [Terriglobales bacterium]|nr:elongation factor G [Terriglobales bacterium]
MKVYEGTNVRNVVLVGHGDAGKTSLVSGMLYTAGSTQRLGRVDDGSSVTDFDEEEIARSMSISTALAFAEWGKTKINFLDTPGFTLFAHEAKLAMVAAESALVVVDGVSGVEVVTEKVWNYCEEFQLPRAIVVSRMDRDRADFGRVMESLTSAFGRTAIPVQLPIGSEKNLSGVVDLAKMKAYSYELAGNGKGREGEIPGSMADAARKAHENLVELIAEGNDTLMEEFFDKGTISEEHLVSGLREAVRERRIYPVLFASGLGNIGSDRLLDFIIDYLPSAIQRAAVKGAPSSGNGEPPQRKVADSEPLSMYVFKTVSDPFAGRITFFKVFSGIVKTEATLQNFMRNTSEKLSHLSVMQGKNQVPVPELRSGDIGAVAKLRDTLTGDTLGDKAAPIQYPQVKLPEPAISFAVEPKTRADEDKLSNGIHKLMEEDPMLRFYRDPQTKEFLVAGTGQQHIEVVVSKLKKRYHTEVNLKAPKVPYRETIRGRADVEGRHKKQTGGHGQYGVCRIKMEPLP